MSDVACGVAAFGSCATPPAELPSHHVNHYDLRSAAADTWRTNLGPGRSALRIVTVVVMCTRFFVAQGANSTEGKETHFRYSQMRRWPSSLLGQAEAKNGLHVETNLNSQFFRWSGRSGHNKFCSRKKCSVISKLCSYGAHI